MNHDDYDNVFNRADRMPTLLAGTDPFDECDAMRVVEHESCSFEIDAMLCLVAQERIGGIASRSQLLGGADLGLLLAQDSIDPGPVLRASRSLLHADFRQSGSL